MGMSMQDSADRGGETASRVWPDEGRHTDDQGGVQDPVLAVWIRSVLEEEGGVFHQAPFCGHEERRLTQRGALLHRAGA